MATLRCTWDECTAPAQHGRVSPTGQCADLCTWHSQALTKAIDSGMRAVVEKSWQLAGTKMRSKAVA